MRLGRHGWAALLLWLALLWTAGAREVIPPAPRAYVTDEAGVLAPETVRRLNEELGAFERATSNQVVAVVYPRMLSDSSIEDYTVRVAQAWGVGQKERRNGVVLFVFIEDRSVYIQVGYGLEGALTDFLSKQIIENEIFPRFRQGDYSGGVAAGVHAIMAATKGEYQGTGRVAQGQGDDGSFFLPLLLFFGLWFLVVLLGRLGGGGRSYTGRGPRTHGGGYWGGGGFGGGGGGGFSGGGGSFGGGGAGGRW